MAEAVFWVDIEEGRGERSAHCVIMNVRAFIINAWFDVECKMETRRFKMRIKL